MDSRFLLFAGIVAIVVVALNVILRCIGHKRVKVNERIRRGTGHAMLGLQEFIEPSVEYIFQAENVEQKEEDDDKGLGGDEEAVRSNLADALGQSPVDHEEIRRHLTAALRAGLDWRSLFEQAVADELRERPYRAPSMPPARRVAPRVGP